MANNAELKMQMGKLKPYKRNFEYSYTLGAFTTIEMINTRPEIVKAVYVHSKYSDRASIEDLCNSKSIAIVYDDKLFNRITQKENSFIIGVFEKYACTLSEDKPHIVLVNPSDMGNLGTIIRTMVGLNFKDLAIISPAADLYDPKAIRASMGALFHINFCEFSSFGAYRQVFSQHNCFPFLVNGKLAIRHDSCPEVSLFSLVFGNEATGLGEEFESIGIGVKIPFLPVIDSFNLAVAAGIGMFEFACRNRMV